MTLDECNCFCACRTPCMWCSVGPQARALSRLRTYASALSSSSMKPSGPTSCPLPSMKSLRRVSSRLRRSLALIQSAHAARRPRTWRDGPHLSPPPVPRATCLVTAARGPASPFGLRRTRGTGWPPGPFREQSAFAPCGLRRDKPGFASSTRWWAWRAAPRQVRRTDLTRRFPEGSPERHYERSAGCCRLYALRSLGSQRPCPELVEGSNGRKMRTSREP
jgi:hypothetical protein